MPTNFRTLPSELRQAILIHSYDATTSSWSSKPEDHIPNIATWFNTLNDVHNDLTDDIEYAKSIWLKQLEEAANKEWYYLLPIEREAIWHGTRGGISPWRWVHRVLLCLNITRNVSPDHAWQRHQWGPGPSDVVWDSWGYKHPRSSWDRVGLEAAAYEDIEWLEVARSHGKTPKSPQQISKSITLDAGSTTSRSTTLGGSSELRRVNHPLLASNPVSDTNGEVSGKIKTETAEKTEKHDLSKRSRTRQSLV